MMRVMVVCSFKFKQKDNVSPFVREQVAALCNSGVECEFFRVRGKGVVGYLRQLKFLRKRIKEFNPDVIHAHFGLCGLLANLQRKVPVVTTYHGSDINDKRAFPFSKMAIRLSAWNIFVSKKTIEIAKPKENYSLLPCGIDFSYLQLTQKSEARKKMKLDLDKNYILFAGAFDNQVKNAPLAKEAVALLRVENLELLELKDYSREEVTLLMCAADAFLMTSFTEGSPQVIKEALACGCPIVSVDVGDVRERVEGVEGCFISESRKPVEIALLLERVLQFEGKTRGRKRIIQDGLYNNMVVKTLVKVYESVVVLNK